ncbi:HSF-type DNA-binding protein [Colletotrichum costaricense]|uniref:HSF-type DNA-binding protein n=1 Tax=Colletotrichum costaricense TaxID=1209916 RepID=A0AAI9Z614_9PEZI|nr:HSF-type DNA-binding protein [Colletotrichum costaricense]KAK1534376.1 HSF-type DNA-binding protein [Colletotrichum costaricense]
MHIPMSSNPRKRPAPGTIPTMPMPQVGQSFPSPPGDQFLRWGGAADAATGLVDGTGAQAVNSYGLVPGQQQQQQQQTPQQFVQPTPSPNNAVARRQMNRALVPTGARQNFDSSSDPWSFVGEDSALLQQQQANGNMAETDNVEILEEMARKAMREAQQKRKQIPPFVQKLSSFLDDDKNSELIRWSEKGDSFIVLDEDEFAKKLIPDLFKHNNYASFVRQLNMYGFHKRVGLSDNSMRASERKNKSPSEYSNPFFRRGHPNLLWLINKPKSGNKGKKGAKNAEVEGDSEEDAVNIDDGVTQGFSTASAPASKALPPSGDMPIQKKEMTLIREELAKVREQQRMIMTAIQRIQQDNTALYQQAVVFQSQHDRHQNSINAILNFLANVFRKTLEDQAGPQSVNDLLASIIPNGNSSSSVPQGSVVDLGDYVQAQTSAGNNINIPKRRQALLPPIPNGRANTVSPSPASGSATPQPYNREMGTVTELFDTSPGDHTSPTNYLAQELESNPHESMMKIIHDTNANNSSGIDLPHVVNNTPATMSNDQRNKMLNAMAGRSSVTPSTNAPQSSKPSMSASPNPPAPSVTATPDTPPPMPAAPGLSLSPIMGSAAPPPSLQQINFNQEDLAALHRMQEEQAAKLDHLSSMLGPLSPSGRIPGIDENGNVNGYFDGDLDIDQFLNPDAFQGDNAYPGVNFNGDGNDFNFTLDGSGPQNGGGNNNNVNGTPSSTGTEEVPRDSFDGITDSPDRGNKRRRVG